MHLKPHRRGVFFNLSVWQRVNGRWLSDQSERVIYFCYVIKQNIKIPFYYLAWCLVLCSNFVPRALFPGFGGGAKLGKSALGTRLGLIRRTSYAWPGLTVNSADGKNPITQRPFRTDVLNVFKPGRRNLSPARAWKLSSRLFSRLDWLPLDLRGWEQCGVYSTIMNEKPGTL